MGLRKAFEDILLEDTLNDDPRMRGLDEREKEMCQLLVRNYKRKHERIVGLSKAQFVDFVFAFFKCGNDLNKELERKILRDSNVGQFRIRASIPWHTLEGDTNAYLQMGSGLEYKGPGVPSLDAPFAYVLEIKSADAPRSTVDKDESTVWRFVACAAFRIDPGRGIFFMDQLQGAGRSARGMMGEEAWKKLDKLRGSFTLPYEAVVRLANQELAARLGYGAVGLIRPEIVSHEDFQKRIREGSKTTPYHIMSKAREHVDRVPWLPEGGPREYTYEILKTSS